MKKTIISLVVTMMGILVVGCGTSDSDTISVITREEGSGTRSAFVEITGILEDDTDNTTLEAIVLDGTGKVVTAVQNDKNAIGYVSLGSLNETVKGLSVNDVYPTSESVKDGSYPVARPFNIALKDGSVPVTEDFIAFIVSKEGQEIVTENSFVSIYENEAFKSTMESGTIIIGGSTSVYPLMEKLAEAYKVINPNVTINIEAIGSSAGIKGAIDGTFDIGMASRELKSEEKEASREHMAIAQDGIAIIANIENEIEGVTLEQIKEIYKGTITNYAEVK